MFRSPQTLLRVDHDRRHDFERVAAAERTGRGATAGIRLAAARRLLRLARWIEPRAFEIPSAYP
jgi:hypothetical protein